MILPEKLPTKGGRLPVLYIIPGFGGDHFMADRWHSSRTDYAADFIRVILDPDCGTGHHVFADSATNGPRGKAFVEEFIPHLERSFPAVAEPRGRLLNGHSSGGWSSLWLQVAYPEFFGGTWSTSPDPVDFRDVQQINIYAPNENMFLSGQGTRRPIARMGNTPALYYDRFSRMDDAIGPGGQLGSFEAVFSPLGPDGRPRKLWDRSTGRIDPEVARAWEAYDIRLILERNWPALGPSSRARSMSLPAAAIPSTWREPSSSLKESLARLGSDAVIEIIPDADHGSVMSPQFAKRLDREMKATARQISLSRVSHAATLILFPTGTLARTPRINAMPVLEREEYIEQVYFFRAVRERLVDGLPSQEILAQIGEELTVNNQAAHRRLLSACRNEGNRRHGARHGRIAHYFTPFQAHVVSQAENESSRFPMEQALLVLEHEAKFKAEQPAWHRALRVSIRGARANRLGYNKGLAAMAADPLYTEDWQDYILTLRTRLGDVDFADLIFVRSEQFVQERRRNPNPEFQPKFPVLFGAKGGKSPGPTAAAIPCISLQPFSARLGYPEVPHPPARRAGVAGALARAAHRPA